MAPPALVVCLAFPDLSFHEVIAVPFAGIVPVPRGSAESYQFCRVTDRPEMPVAGVYVTGAYLYNCPDEVSI